MRVRTFLASIMLSGMAAIAVAAVDQPNMTAARSNLQTAKAELQRATPDKGGHRGKAIGLVNSAIAEVNAGIAFDRRHNHPVSSVTDAIFSAAPDQPHMQNALASLQSAKEYLEHATTDKGGHRAKALDYVKTAIDEVKKGIEAGRN